MSKVKSLLRGPVAAARRVLDECDVRHPRDIRVESMAARYGALVVFGPVETARGSIVRTSKRAVIWVDEDAKGEPRADFTGAHELGHHVMHDVVDHFAQCHGEDGAARGDSPEELRAYWRARTIERQANHFATELLMPSRWAAPLCDLASPELDDVDRLSRTFRTSFHASAIRYIELTRAPCAFVHTVGGVIKRSTETAAFPGTITQGDAVHPGSVAARLQTTRPGGGGDGARPREVCGAAWGGDGGAGFLEYAIALGSEVGVMSWIVASA